MSLASLSKQTMQVAAHTGTTYTGDPTYDTAATHLGRVSYRNKRILTAAGVERVSTAHITVETPVYDADLITLPDGVARVPLAVKRTFDKNGTFHHSSIDI